ncbi:MAG TPA: DUF4382 domain-containing protein [Spirochaetota bacterium]|nr:DUF4382 domain-containing protein [Spirochaetota bacterium]
MKKPIILIALLASFSLLTACGEDDATLVVRMVDAPVTVGTYQVEGVYVDINRVDVVKKGSAAETAGVTQIQDGSGVYTVIANANMTNVNLLDLVNGASKLIGSITLDPGDYIQLRIVVGTNSKIKFANDTALYALKTPSGSTSGIKIKGKGNDPLFSIAEGDTSELAFDFDAQASLQASVDKDKYILSPVIKEVKYRSQTKASNEFDVEK